MEAWCLTATLGFFYKSGVLFVGVFAIRPDFGKLPLSEIDSA